MLKVENTVEVLEFNDTEMKGENIRVINHWNRNELVVLVIAGNKYTVMARDLKAATDNATNTVRF